MKNQRNRTRDHVGLALTFVALIGAATLVLAPPRHASAQATIFNWTQTGNLNAWHTGHTAMLLQNGKVLIAGGYNNQAEIYDPATGSWTTSGNPKTLPQGCTITLLTNGKVLVAGGSLEDNSGSSNTAQLYDPVTGTWTITGSLKTSRALHTATALPNGKVLVAGGQSYSYPGNYFAVLSSAELYDPATGTWSFTGNLVRRIESHTAISLQDGRVLVSGGQTLDAPGSLNYFDTNNELEIYDPNAGAWSHAGFLKIARSGRTVTSLQNGKVLVAGGYDLNSAEVCDPAVGSCTSTGSLQTGRNGHTATLLPSGKVLVVGGANWVQGDQGSLASNAETYDPTSGTWTRIAGPINQPYGHSATVLQNGKVLVASGNTAELYDPAVDATASPPQNVGASWTYTGNLNSFRAGHSAIRLTDGRVLVAGGYNYNQSGLFGVNSAELYDPSTGTWSYTANPSTVRAGHTATLLANGKVLVAGGTDGSHPPNPLSSAELYDPATGTWTSTGILSTARRSLTATLLLNGKVLVTGTEGTDNSAEQYDPTTGTWSNVGSLTIALSGKTAARLPNGKVLVTGTISCDSEECQFGAELYDPATETWTATSGPSSVGALTPLLNGKVLSYGQLYDAATEAWSQTGVPSISGSQSLLTDGKVIRVGTPSAEVYDPATGLWSGTASLNTARGGFTTTPLLNGQVLVAGGNVWAGPGTLNSAEVYNPGSSATSTPTPTPTPTATPTATPTPTPTSTPAAAGPTWTLTGNLNGGRDSQTATRLQNGKVLVVGGNDSNGTLKTVELYDPATGMWSTTASLNTSSAFHTATLLPNGKVLVAGGYTCGPPPQTCDSLNSSELYDPATGTWTSTGNLNSARDSHVALLLHNGKVLVVGGDDNRNGAEIYDPITGTWSVTGSFNLGRYAFTATLLVDGKVLLAGGSDAGREQVFASADLYDPTTGSWSTTGSLLMARSDHTATLLQNGKVLIAGGFVDYGSGQVTNSTELYDPATGLWSNTGNLNQRRALHTGTVLSGGKVLIAGGFFVDNFPNITDSAELYDPASGTWSNTVSMNARRRFHTTTLLLNGRVLAVGGQAGPVAQLNSAELYFPGPNPIDDADFFVRQHYRDFLGREADAPGEAHWTGEITMCSDSVNRLPGETGSQCIDRKRTNTSGAFYLSNEFQNSANFLIRVNWGSLGQDRAVGRKCINGQYSSLDAVCNPLYSQYVADMAKLTQGIVINDQLDPNAINANKHNFVNEFVMRAEFLAAYPNTMTAAEYVDKLFQTTGIAVTTQERSDLINEAAMAGGRANVLYKIVDGTTTIDGGFLRFDTRYGKAYYDQQFNPVFVFVEYLGYLRRNPDQAGYDHWLGKLNLYGNFTDAEMVRSFMVSGEYRGRFGQP